MFDWEGVGRTPQTAGAVLEAAERAAEDGGQDWAAVRKGLAGELPAPRKEERVAERERQMAREEWRREAAEAAAAAEGVEMAAREAWRRAEARVRRAAANAGEVGEAGDAEAAELVAWAKAIGVAVDADRGAVRTAWRRAALRMHPDKRGGCRGVRRARQRSVRGVRDRAGGGHGESWRAGEAPDADQGVADRGAQLRSVG